MSVHKKNVIYIYIYYICWKNKVKIFQMMLVGTMTLLTRSVDVVRLAIGDGKPLRALAISINQYEHQHQCYFPYRHQQWQCGIVVKSQNKLQFRSQCLCQHHFQHLHIQLFITQYRFLSVSFLTQHDVHIIWYIIIVWQFQMSMPLEDISPGAEK